MCNEKDTLYIFLFGFSMIKERERRKENNRIRDEKKKI